MKLSVVIVNYNVKFYLQQCLLSLRRALEGVETEVYVVDNCSRDGSVDYLSARFPEVRFISSGRNLGFARANNIAIRQSKGEYVLLLNPDTIVGEDVLSEALRFVDAHPDAGAVGVKMLNAWGGAAMESRRGVPDPLTAFYKMCGLCSRFPRSRRFAHYYMSYLPWDKPVEIEIVSGAFCLLRRKALDEAGLLDKSFFMYGEDIDLSFRILQKGWHNWYLPLEILHYKGESTQKTSYRYVHVFYEAMLIFFKKHYTHLSSLLSLPIKAAIYAKAFTALARLQWWRLRRWMRLSHEDASVAQSFVLVSADDAHAALFDAIAMRNDLTYERTSVMSASQLQQYADPLSAVCIVYDMAEAGRHYADVLRAHAQCPDRELHMAFFYPDENIVITDKDIFR